MTTSLTLAAEFPPVDLRRWRQLVDAALKGADFEKRLVSRTYDGLRIEPLYPRARQAVPIGGRPPGAPWTLMQRIDHADPKMANAQILDDLENGATGLTLVFDGSLNANGFGLPASAKAIAQALDDVALDAITIDFNLSAASRGAIDHVAALVKSRKLDPGLVDLRASLNPVGGLAASGVSPKPWPELSRYFAAAVRSLVAQGFHSPLVVADGRVIHNAGGSEAQELAFALGSAIEYLRALEAGGLALAAARDLIFFRLAADADEFLTIAKFRAMRKLWARVEAACGLTPKPTIVAAETAWRMLTKRDPDVNMLRATIAVTAAGVGGADTIAVLPHTAAFGLPDRFARRVARNIQLVLLEESNLAKVADPAAGSGAIEALTDALCAAAWSKFQLLESAGGIWAALEQGLIQREVAAVRNEREAAIARRKDKITGTSDYPDLNETPPAVLAPAPARTASSTGHIEALPSIRLTEPFEALRERSDAIKNQGGKRPSVFLANLGKPSAFTVRASFARNFFESGGIEATDSHEFTSGSEMIAAFKASGAKLACLCSSDKVYETEAAGAAQALSAEGAIVHLAGRPGEHEAQWRAAGVKAFIYAGCDALAILRAAHDILAGT